MNSPERQPASEERQLYGRMVYVLAYAACLFCLAGPLLAMAFPHRATVNPYRMFQAILAGQDTASIWIETTGGFPGPHFYLRAGFSGDGLTQFGLVLGCTASAWALLAAGGLFWRRRAWGYAGLAFCIAVLVFVSALR